MKMWRGMRRRGEEKAAKTEKIVEINQIVRINKKRKTNEIVRKARNARKADEEKIVNREGAGKRIGSAGKAFLMLVWIVLGVWGLAGCSAAEDNGDKVRDLEFSVAADPDVPKELGQLIAEKIHQPFKLTYSDDSNLYIAVGYGAQPTGGYSICVNDLYLTENSIVLDTELKGPERGENPGTEQSFPYIVIKTEYLEQPVIFR